MHIEDLISYQEKLDAIAEKQTATARQYVKARRSYAKSLFELKDMLAVSLSEFRQQKKNLGVDMAILMKMEQQDEGFKKVYYENLMSEAEYKGLEKALDALQGQAIGVQSIMKYMAMGEKFS